MTKQLPTRGAESRALPGQSARTARGRSAAPRFIAWIPDAWRPIVSKLVGGLLAAIVLAMVGFNARTPISGLDSDPVVLTSSLLGPSSLSTSPGSPSPELDAGAGGYVIPTAGDSAAPDPISRPLASDSSAATGPSAGILPDGRIVLNQASEEDLRRLPGIGPTRARAIVALRQRLAKFRAVEDLLRVKGIGRKTVQRIRSAVVVNRPPG